MKDNARKLTCVKIEIEDGPNFREKKSFFFGKKNLVPGGNTFAYRKT